MCFVTTSWSQTFSVVSNPDAGSGLFFGNFARIGNTLYFSYLNASGKNQLGKYDGTTLSLVPNPSTADLGFTGNPLVVGTILYFSYQDAAGKNHLAKYDGTTVSVINNPSTADPGIYTAPVAIGNTLYYNYLNAAGNYQLAKYDGTGTSLTLVANPSATDAGFTNQVAPPVVIGTTLYARYQVDTVGYLAKYDGSNLTIINNPVMGKGVYTSAMQVMGTTVYLTYFNAAGVRQLAMYNGSGTTLSLVSNPDASPYGNYGNFFPMGTNLYLRYMNASQKYQLAKYDGTSLSLISNPSASDYGFSGITPVIMNNQMYFRYQNAAGNYQLGKYDGTSITAISNASPTDYGFINFMGGVSNPSGILYFRYGTGTSPNQVAKYDGTTLTVIPNPNSTDPGNNSIGLLVGGTLYFSYVTPSPKYHLAKYDGNTETVFNNLSSIDQGVSEPFTLIGNTLYFPYAYGTGTQYQLGKYTINTLPVTLLDFTASRTGSKVTLNWQTANEINTAHFDVQRSKDGASFTTIGETNAIGSGANTYHYTDALPLAAPVVYYRLQMMDKDGSFTYSQVASVVFNPSPLSFSITPNPAKDVVYVNSSNETAIRIMDNTGKLLISQPVNNTGRTGINIASLPKGVYIVQVRDNQNNIQTEKLVKE